MADYTETDLSKRIRERLRELADKGEIIESAPKTPFRPSLRNLLSLDGGILDINKVYKSLGVDFPRDMLGIRCLELNLNDEEAHSIIKHRFRVCYSPQHNPGIDAESCRQTAAEMYPVWCGGLGITPASDFPDW